MVGAQQHLERAAIDAYRAGQAWADFWQEWGARLLQAEPYDRGRFRRLVNRLLALVTSGDTDGMEPAGEPWLLDDVQAVPAPADVGTAARCLWPMERTG